MVTSSGPPGVAASRASIPAAGASKQGLEYKQHIQLGRVNGSFREQGGLYLVTQCSSLPGKHTTHAGGSVSPPSPISVPGTEEARAQALTICIRDHCWKAHSRLVSCMNAVYFSLWWKKKKKLLWRSGSYYSVLCMVFCLI